MLHPDNPYLEKTIRELDGYEEGLWYHLDRVPHLPPIVGLAILYGFLEQTCQSSAVEDIEVG
jgi:hypothetical protein